MLNRSYKKIESKKREYTQQKGNASFIDAFEKIRFPIHHQFDLYMYFWMHVVSHGTKCLLKYVAFFDWIKYFNV